MSEHEGRCAQCDTDGPVGAPCGGTTRCARDGYRFIPLADHAVRYGDKRSIPPEIGREYGDFLVVRRLGEGGIGGVFVAMQAQVGLRAALKLLTTDSPALIEKFQTEARALARLSHPHIVRLLTFGEAHGQQYLVMELVEGHTLQAVAQRGLTTPEAVAILRQLADGLEAAHAAGIVHRDIKPANIMVQALPRRGWFVRLVDFGLAKDTADDQTSVIIGTPTYMAPEQYDRVGIGPWTDVYAVAVLACGLLTGHTPFKGLGTAETYLAKKDRSFEPISPGLLPLAAEDALRAGMAVEPADRPDLHTLIDRLEAGLDPAAVPLLPSEDVEPEPTEEGPRRLPLALIAALVLVLAGATAFALVWSVAGPPDAGLDAAVARPDAARPARPARPDAARPDAARPDAATPARLDAAGRDAAVRDVAARDAARPDPPDAAARATAARRRVARPRDPAPPTAAPPTAAPPTAAPRPPPSAAPATAAPPTAGERLAAELAGLKRRCACGRGTYVPLLERLRGEPDGPRLIQAGALEWARCPAIIDPDAERCENGKVVPR